MTKPARRVLWNRSALPTPYVSSKLGISRRELGEAIHEIKALNGLRGDDRITILENGDVEDEYGNLIGNILDEC